MKHYLTLLFLILSFSMFAQSDCKNCKYYLEFEDCVLICKKSNGSKEYIAPTSFTYDKKDKTISFCGDGKEKSFPIESIASPDLSTKGLIAWVEENYCPHGPPTEMEPSAIDSMILSTLQESYGADTTQYNEICEKLNNITNCQDSLKALQNQTNSILSDSTLTVSIEGETFVQDTATHALLDSLINCKKDLSDSLSMWFADLQETLDTINVDFGPLTDFLDSVQLNVVIDSLPPLFVTDTTQNQLTETIINQDSSFYAESLTNDSLTLINDSLNLLCLDSLKGLLQPDSILQTTCTTTIPPPAVMNGVVGILNTVSGSYNALDEGLCFTIYEETDFEGFLNSTGTGTYDVVINGEEVTITTINPSEQPTGIVYYQDGNPTPTDCDIDAPALAQFTCVDEIVACESCEQLTEVNSNLEEIINQNDTTNELLDSLIKSNIDYEIDYLPYCVGGVQVSVPVFYTAGELQPFTPPDGGVYGWCPSTDTTDYEITRRFICVNDTTVEVRTFWENNTEVATLYEGLAAPPLEFTEGKCEVDRKPKNFIEACLYLSDGNSCPGTIVVTHETDTTESFKFYQDGVVIDSASVLSWESGECNKNRQYFQNCFLPDQYAIVWSWAGNGDITSYDPLTGETIYHGQSPEGGFALAFKNDLTEPTLYFQRSGQLWKASPDDPVGTFTLVGTNNLPAFPCFDFDPSGRLLAGNGNSAYEINPDDGSAVFLGNLIDARDGANLSVGPGDWYFDPNGAWFMMARDNRGASFTDPNGVAYCTNTALWKIDPSTLVAQRVNNSCAPTSGTGATWLAAGQGLLSTSSGQMYVHNTYTETWELDYNADNNDQGQNVAVNDLASQWVIPDALLLCGWKDLSCTDSSVCETTLYEIRSNPETGVQECNLYTSTLQGKWGVCQKESNPYVTDPSQKDDEFLSDQAWHEGCSDAGFTYWRVSYDPSFNPVYEYVYKGIDLNSPVTSAPGNFCPIPCGESPSLTETTQWCNEDNTPNTSVFRKEFSDGTVLWFDETGEIPEPTDKTPGECADIDPLLPVTEQIVCIAGKSFVRVVKEQYVENAEGLPELVSYQILYYNEDGELYDSGIIPAGDGPVGEPKFDYFGDCNDPYIEIRNEPRFECDAEFLLLIDSGGGFARYSLFTKQWETVSTLSVSSAGCSADYDKFLLYCFVAPDQLNVVDVNTDTQLPAVTLTDGVIKPGLTTNPKNFSAASFRTSNGLLYAWDTGGTDAGLYSVNPTTGVVDFVTTVSGVAGAGTSIAIDNTQDLLIINGSNLSYSVDWVTGVGTQWGDPPIQPNGSTFDASGGFYVTQGNDTYSLEAGADPNDPANYTQIIDDWAPGANSLAYYRTQAQNPNCFHRRTGYNTLTGEREIIGDFWLDTNDPRTIVGNVSCEPCDDGCCASGGSGEYNGPSAAEIATAIVDGQASSDEWADHIANAIIDGCPNTYLPRQFDGTGTATNVQSITVRVETGTATVTLPDGSVETYEAGDIQTWIYPVDCKAFTGTFTVTQIGGITETIWIEQQ